MIANKFNNVARNENSGKNSSSVNTTQPLSYILTVTENIARWKKKVTVVDSKFECMKTVVELQEEMLSMDLT